MASNLICFAFETITVSTTAKALTVATYNPSANLGQPGYAGAWMALLTTETDGLRWRNDGVAPTTSVGHVLAAGSTMTIWVPNLAAFLMIRDGAVDVPVSVSYYRSSDR